MVFSRLAFDLSHEEHALMGMARIFEHGAAGTAAYRIDLRRCGTRPNHDDDRI